MNARLVKIRGKLQCESGVIHVVADHIEDMTPMLGLLQREARRFGACERADEVLRPTADHRQKRRSSGMEAFSPDTQARDITRRNDTAETASVMPKGRNFH
ncbi:error-prone DNA polymerase [compost metagenome]